MFGRIVIAQLKASIRSKRYMFWTFAFPIVLGTLFYFAFNSIYDSQKTETIPVIINVTDRAIHEYQVMEAFSKLDTTTMTEDLELYYLGKSVTDQSGQILDYELPVTDEELDTVESVQSYDDMADCDMTNFPYDYMVCDRSKIEALGRDDLPFIETIQDLTYDDGTKMIEEVFISDNRGELSADELAKAEEMLSDGDIAGIITVDTMKDVSLLVNGNGVKHSILSTIISEYRLQVNMAIDTINEDHDNLKDSEKIMDESTKDIEFVEEKNMAGDNKDPFVAYFYNLVAMVAIMGSIGGMNVIVNSQANQSNTGVRIDVSPAKKVVVELAQLTAIVLIQLMIIAVLVTYLVFILKIKFGGNIGFIYLTSFLASLIGDTLGFMIAHFGKLSSEKKEAILMVIMLGGGFMSGLMYGDMKMIVEQNFPWFNRINPSAVITDAFYALNVFGVGPRYYKAVAYMVLTSAVMLAVGCALSRKTSYKSL